MFSGDGQRWVTGLAGATRFMTGILMGTAMAVYVGRVGSPFAVSMVMSTYYLGMMLFAPVWGAVADVTGRRRAVLVGTSVAATIAIVPLAVVGAAGPALRVGPVTIPGVWAPITLRGLYAVFAAGFVPVVLTVVSARGGADERGRSLGFFSSVRAGGFSAGQLSVGFLLGLLATPSSLYAVVAAVSVLATVLVVFVDDPTPPVDRTPTVRELVAETRARILPAPEDRAHFDVNGLRWLYVALALRNMTVLGVMSLMPVYLTQDVGVSEFVMGALLAINPTGQVLCMLLFGRIADAVGRKPLVVAGMAGSGAFALLAAAATLPGDDLGRAAVAAVALVVVAAVFSAMTTGALAFIGDVAQHLRDADADAEERESELMGLRTTAKGVGGVVGPPIFGVLATVAGIQFAFAAGSVLAFAAAVVAWAGLTETRPATGGVGEVSEFGDD